MNNRQIKFRTWDKEYKEFSEWTNRDPFFSTSHGQIFFWERVHREDDSYGGDIILQDNNDRFILQQFTGLLDAEGREIYEGDLVKVNLHDPEIGEVIFNNGGFRMQSKSFKGTFLGIVTSGFLIKVAGNIFEDSELLKP